ncbi:MAG: hypothetical protein GDA40_08885 [Rhodobacteraceae bacterium]|nr:hypothetical protein [Paracoccaceae bacterium]
MARYNTTFELDVDDLELIETAFQHRKSELSLKRLKMLFDPAPKTADRVAEIEATFAETHDLLGRLHNQKVWYRPKTAGQTPYIDIGGRV